VVEIGEAETPELDAMIPKTWRDRTIADWFLRVVEEPPGRLEYSVSGFFGLKRRTTPAWWIDVDGTSYHICTDGRICYHNQEPGEPHRFGGGFSVGALEEMLEMAELPILDVPPRPPPPPAARTPVPPAQYSPMAASRRAYDSWAEPSSRVGRRRL
jgi:hypothetical protein